MTINIGEKKMQLAVNEFKAKLSEYLKHLSEPLYITRHGKVVAKVLPSNDEEAWKDIAKDLKGSLLKYDDPTEPVGEEDWETLK